MARKLSLFLAALFLTAMLALPVFGAVGAEQVSTTAMVSSDGSCHVNMALTLISDGGKEDLYFPLPTGASGIRVNGARVLASKSGDVLQINLKKYVKNVTGTVSVNIQYDLYGLVKETEHGFLQLELPLLSGFSQAIESLEFTVSLPGPVEQLPGFTSGYHQASIEQYLTCSAEGNTITGSSLKALNDHETLLMTMPVSEAYFSRVIVGTQSTEFAEIAMAVCASLALAYWLLALRTLPTFKRAVQLPEGFCAGQLGSLVGGGGMELSLAVLSWAELGYILIEPDRRGRVLLRKRMDMGNERSEFEQRCFQKLFGTRQSVDTTGSRFASLQVELAKRPGGVRELLHKRTGNSLVFRVLSTGIGLFAGAGIGALLGAGAALQWLLIGLMGILGAVTGWDLLSWTDNGLFRDKLRLLRSGIWCVLWIILSVASGGISLGLWMLGGLLLCGILYGFGGRRTELGRQLRAETLGLRWYLMGFDREDLRRVMEEDPNYFFRMAPYAIALGVGKQFAKAVGKFRPEGCSYLSGYEGAALSPEAWNQLMTKTLDDMERRSRRLGLEKFIALLNRITKP